jgi:DNA-binding GntR family transcriptional regulator
MDALKRIAGDGLIEIIPQVGCRVVSPTLDEVLDYFRLFASAEGICAELAAHRAQTAELRTLERASAQIGALAADDPDRLAISHDYRVLNRQFHAQIHAMAASPTLASIAAGMWDRSDFYIATAKSTVLFAERLSEAHAEHEAVRKAIADRDPERARVLMEQHVVGFARAIRRNQERLNRG